MVPAPLVLRGWEDGEEGAGAGDTQQHHSEETEAYQVDPGRTTAVMAETGRGETGEENQEGFTGEAQQQRAGDGDEQSQNRKVKGGHTPQSGRSQEECPEETRVESRGKRNRRLPQEREPAAKKHEGFGSEVASLRAENRTPGASVSRRSHPVG